MDPAAFSPDAPGRFVQAYPPVDPLTPSPQGRQPRPYWAFVPHPLPPELTLDVDTIVQLSEAERAIGELRGIGHRLPNPHLLINPFLRREAVLSSRIEGTRTNVRQLLVYEAAPEDSTDRADAQEVLNYVEPWNMG